MVDAVPILERCLALRILEMPVATWVGDELEHNKSLPSELHQLLQLNQQDEVKHDQVLNNIADVFPVPAKIQSEAQEIADRWFELAEKYNPILVAGIAESSLFFVILPIYRFLGSKVFRTVANDISNDENVHVATNIQLSMDMGYNRGEALNKLRAETIEWITADLPERCSNKFMSRSHWRTASYNLYHKGKASELSDTRRAVMPAFFEASNDKLPIYG